MSQYCGARQPRLEAHEQTGRLLSHPGILVRAPHSRTSAPSGLASKPPLFTAAASGGWQRDEGAGRNPSGFSLREFLRSKKEGWRSAALCVPRFPFFSVQPITLGRLNREGPADAAQNPGCRPGGVLPAGGVAFMQLVLAFLIQEIGGANAIAVSFVTQCDHWIHFHGLARGHITS